MTFEKIRLADCCIIKPPKSEVKKLLSSDDEVSFVSMRELGIDCKTLILESDKKLSEVSGSYTYFAENDVLLAKITPCFENGKLGIATDLTNGIGFGSSEFIVFRSKGNVEPNYLYYYLLQPSFRDLGQKVMSGAVGHKRVPKDFIENTEIPLPSISEQKRIVAILDQAFADIEQARAKTEQNLKNARELFESKKVNLFDSLSTASNLKPLPLVCTNIFAGGDAPKKGLYSKEKTEDFNIPIYANAVKKNGLYGFTDYSRADEPSITIAARGSGTGHIELRKEPFLPIVRLIVLTPNKDIVCLEYLKHALQTLDILRSGSAIPQLTVPMIKEYSIPVPSLDVQQTTVSGLEGLNNFIGRIEEIYKEKIVRLDELKKSILQKAFTGELTKQKEGAAA